LNTHGPCPIHRYSYRPVYDAAVISNPSCKYLLSTESKSRLKKIDIQKGKGESSAHASSFSKKRKSTTAMETSSGSKANAKREKIMEKKAPKLIKKLDVSVNSSTATSSTHCMILRNKMSRN
jgi:hypothetical protein